jgi:hypothetical protein
MTPRKIEAKAGVRRLFKSRRDRIFDGVCGGIAEYLGVPSAAVRIAWVLLLFERTRHRPVYRLHDPDSRQSGA